MPHSPTRACGARRTSWSTRARHPRRAHRGHDARARAPAPSCPGWPSSWRPSSPARRGAEDVTPEAAIVNLLRAFEAGLRKVLARMGISTATSYLGGQLFEVLELQPEVTERCFPAAPRGPAPSASRPWPQASAATARRAPPAEGPGVKLADPGWARFRADGERHLYAPTIVKAIQELAGARPRRRRRAARATATTLHRRARHRPRPAGPGACSREPRHLTEVEPADGHPAPLRGRRHEPGRPQPRGAPGADHRPAPAGHVAQQWRGRRGPGVVRRHRRRPP